MADNGSLFRPTAGDVGVAVLGIVGGDGCCAMTNYWPWNRWLHDTLGIGKRGRTRRTAISPFQTKLLRWRSQHLPNMSRMIEVPDRGSLMTPRLSGWPTS